MPLPEFNHQEDYLIRYIKTAGWHPGGYTTTYLTCGLLMSGFGFYLESTALMLTAMLTVFGFKVYEEWLQVSMLPVWKSVIAKYEAAITAADAIAERPEVSK